MSKEFAHCVKSDEMLKCIGWIKQNYNLNYPIRILYYRHTFLPVSASMLILKQSMNKKKYLSATLHGYKHEYYHVSIFTLSVTMTICPKCSLTMIYVVFSFT